MLLFKIKGTNGVYLTVYVNRAQIVFVKMNDTNISELMNNLCMSTKSDMLIVGDFNHGDIDWEIYTAPIITCLVKYIHLHYTTSL